MKKLLTAILILALILPAAALAAEKEVDFFYGYAHIEVSKAGTPFMSMIYFNQDQTCYYVAQMFHDDKPGIGRAYVGTWGYTASGDVFAKTGDNTTITFAITSMGSIVDRETLEVYFPVDALMD